MRVSLHRLVSELIQSLMPLAIRRRNFVLNEISRDLRVNADENMLAYVLWKGMEWEYRQVQHVADQLGVNIMLAA